MGSPFDLLLYVPCSLFPVPCSLSKEEGRKKKEGGESVLGFHLTHCYMFPVPCSLFPVPSLNKEERESVLGFHLTHYYLLYFPCSLFSLSRKIVVGFRPSTQPTSTQNSESTVELEDNNQIIQTV